MNSAYEEITDWLASGFSPADLADYHSSEQTRERVADLIQRSKNERISAMEREELALCLQLEHLLQLAKATVRQATLPVGCLALVLGVISCVTTHKNSPSDTTASELGNNNVVTGAVTNSTFKGDGQDKLIIRGSNNLLTYHISDSDIASYNTKTVTIIEGDNNNFSSTIKKCVLVYKDRTDTVIIKGNKLKIDFRAENIKQLTTVLPLSKSNSATAKPESLIAEKTQPAIAGNSQILTDKKPLLLLDKKQQLLTVTQPYDLRFSGEISVDTTDKHLDLSTVEAATELSGFETLYVKALDKNLPLVAALAYYNQQVQHGDYQAAYQLGELYEGTIFEALIDFPRAIQFYELAARHNQADAAYRLGQIYELGDFEFNQFPPDKVRAKYYFKLAAQNGSVDAKEKLINWPK